MNSMKSQKDRTLKDELPNMLLEISGEITPERMKRWSQSKNSTQLWMTGDGSKVQCCKEQYCIGTWNVKSMSQGKLEVVKQMTRVNVDILGISKLKWTGMDMSLSKLREMVKDREAWGTAVHEVSKSWT